MQDRKLIETLNEFQQEYQLLIEQNMVEKKVNASGALGESIALPRIELLGQVYSMQATKRFRLKLEAQKVAKVQGPRRKAQAKGGTLHE